MVTTTLSYFDFLPRHETEKPYEILINLPEAAQHIPRSNLAFKDHECYIEDARGREEDFTLNKDGFTWRHHQTAVEDLRNRDEIELKYLPETARFIRQNIEGDIRRVHIFDWRRRVSIKQEDFAKRKINLDDDLDPFPPAMHPHIDQSTVGAAKRCNFHLPEKAEDLLKGRFRIINVWRPLSPVLSWPLGLCSAPSVQSGDLVPTDVVRRPYIGEALFAKYNPGHKWVYLSGQKTDEVTMLKVYDSSAEVNARFCLHTGFMASENDNNVVRESLEVRAMVFDYAEP